MNMNVSLPEELANFVKDKVSAAMARRAKSCARRVG
jgi:hypothetical protein